MLVINVCKFFSIDHLESDHCFIFLFLVHNVMLRLLTL